MMPAVCISPGDSYDIPQLQKQIEQIFSTLGVVIKSGMTVVLKPNLVIRAQADSGIITHPNLVAAVGLCVKARGAKVLIAESSGGPFTPLAMKTIFSGCGYTAMAQQHGFQLYLDCESRPVELPNAKLCKRLSVLEPFIHADYIINLAKLKSHCMTVYSGAIKNLFGTVPGLMKPELHCRFPNKSDFAQMLVDLCDFIQPNLSIVDAIDAMEGNGPTGGTKRFVGVLLASLNPYAADVVGSTLAAMKPASVYMLGHAMAQGLCPQSIADISFPIARPEPYVQADFKQPKSKSVDFIDRLPAFLRPAAKKLATPKPVIVQKSCIGCGKCAESCPQHTILIQNGKAQIAYQDCINCFCCHEMCPLHVIDVKRFSLFNW